MKSFEGQVALVTGAGGGIGLATARAFAAAGASVIIADRDAALTEIAADELRSAGHQALAVSCDVTLEGTVRLALLLASPTANPPEPAGAFNETVQEAVPGVLMLEPVQFRLPSETTTGREIEPATPLDGTEVPPAVVPTTLVS